MPAVRRRRLAQDLRQSRLAAGLTCEEAAGKLECSASKISRMETGKVLIAPRDVRDLTRLYGLPPDRQDQLVQLARDSRAKGWWEAYADAVGPHYASYLGLESAAAQIRSYEVGMLPVLLHTGTYAEAAITAGMSGRPDTVGEQLIEMGTERRSVLSQPDPPRLWSVVDEAAIRRQVGGPNVMREQLEHVIMLAAAPNVTFQVMPFSAGAHPSMGRPFVLLSFPDPDDDDVAFLQDTVNAVCIENRASTSRYRQFFDHLTAMALGPDESAALVAAALRKLRPARS
jgi:transcriptional regulator with XRE-family HTH domain